MGTVLSGFEQGQDKAVIRATPVIDRAPLFLSSPPTTLVERLILLGASEEMCAKNARATRRLDRLM